MSTQNTIANFFKSSDVQTGLAALASTAAGLATGVQANSASAGTVAGAVVFGIIHLLLPKDTALATDAEKLVTDGLTAIATKNPEAISQILSDAANVATDVEAIRSTPAPTPAPATTVTKSTAA